MTDLILPVCSSRQVEKYRGYSDTGNSKVDTITTLFKTTSCEWSSFKLTLGVLYLVFEEIECLIPKVKITTVL